MPLEHGALAHTAQVARPQRHGRRMPLAVDDGADGATGGSPHAQAAPAAREALDLGFVAAPQYDRDVDQIAEAAERLVLPGMGGEHERVVLGRERRDARDAEPARHGGGEELRGRRPGDRRRPVRARVQLDDDRQAGPPERPQVVDVLVDVGVEDLLEAGLDQRGLGGLGVVGQQVEVSEAAQAGRAVVERDLRSLHQQQRAVIGGAHAGEEPGSRHLVYGDTRLVGDQAVAEVDAGRAAAARLQQLHPVRAHDVERRRAAGQQGVDVLPHQ